MHLIELRSGREGHPGYRAVAHEMHAQIAAHHPAVAGAMTHVDTTAEPRLERLLSEMRARAPARRRGAMSLRASISAARPSSTRSRPNSYARRGS